MAARRTTAFVVALATLAVALLAVESGFAWQLLETGEYDRETVTIYDENGSELATVEVRIANTSQKRYVGLSETESLPEETGMLFVHPEEENQTYVMRNMSFPLDMIFIDAEGKITTIHHASVPSETPESNLRRYSGRAKWVLEVERGWVNETGVETGDRVSIPETVE